MARPRTHCRCWQLRPRYEQAPLTAGGSFQARPNALLGHVTSPNCSDLHFCLSHQPATGCSTAQPMAIDVSSHD